MPKLNYNFKNDYSKLRTVNAFFTVKNVFTNTEGVTAQLQGSTKEITVDAFTGQIGELVFDIDFNTTDIAISDSNFFYDFGDGNLGQGLSARHIYDEPGEYRITLVVTDSAGNFFRSLEPKTIKVRDLVQDQLFITSTLSTQNYSKPESVITVTRYNSLNTSRVLSSNNYSINLSVSGNNNEFFTNDKYIKDNNFQFKKASYFTKDIGTNFEIIDKIETTSTDLYITPTLVGEKMVLNFSKNNLDGSYYVGTSGFNTFRYNED